MENRYKITYDLKQMVVTNIKFKQGDIDSATLEVNLVDSGLAINVTGETLEFRFLKADKTIVFQDSSAGVTILDGPNGKLECVLKSNTLAFPGEVICEIRRTKDGKRLTTPSFNFKVEGSIAIGGELSTNYISAIDSAIISIAALKNDLQNKVDTDYYRGAKGDAGPQGIKGDTGAQGIQGIKGLDGLGAGDMSKSTYDTTNNGVVDNAEKLGGKLPAEFILTSEKNTAGGVASFDAVALSLADIAIDKAKLEQGVPATMTYNSTPNNGKTLRLLHGDNTTPATDGTISSLYVQRVDKSITSDDAAHLIPTIYCVTKRKSGGTGWMYGALNYLEEESNTGNAQSVACAGMAYAKGNSKVWGVYGDAYSYNPLASITGAEFDAQNMSGTDYIYNQTTPTSPPFSCAIWAMSVGTKNNSFAVGVGGGGTSVWGCGLFLQAGSIKDIGIDIQATPPVAIKLHGASNDGKGSTPGGIGIDAGVGAFYGQGANQGFLHMRNEDICFGETGAGKIRHNEATGQLEFWWNSAKVGHIDLGGADHAL